MTSSSMPTERPAPPSGDDQPKPAPTTPPAPRDRAAEHLTRGLRGVTTYGDIVTGSTTTPTQSRAPDDTKRKGRAFSLHPDIVTRMRATALKRADLIVMAAERYGDQIQHTPRHNLPGRTTIVVRLTDAEHSRLQKIAQKRDWTVSSTVSALLEPYLAEIETARNKTSKRARAKP